MKKSLVILSLFSLLSCHKASKVPDYAFAIGTYDSHDYHQTFDPPIRIGIGVSGLFQQWDLDLDGLWDLRMLSVRNSNNTSLLQTMEISTRPESDWEFAMIPFHDSIFHCTDSGAVFGSTLYTAGKNFACALPLDTFVRVDTLCEVAYLAQLGQTWSAMPRWGNEAFINYVLETYDTTSIRFETTHYLNWGYREHFIPLRQKRENNPGRAWLRVSIIMEEARPAEIQIHEIAVQGAGVI